MVEFITYHHSKNNILTDQAGYFIIILIIISFREKSIKDGLSFVINQNIYIFIIYYMQVISMVFCPRKNSPGNKFARYTFKFMFRNHK